MMKARPVQLAQMPSGTRAFARDRGRTAARIASVVGTSSTAPRPAIARPAISVPTSGAMAQMTEPSREQRNTEREDPPTAKKIRQHAAGQQQARIGEVVGVDDPLQPADVGREIGADAQ